MTVLQMLDMAIGLGRARPEGTRRHDDRREMSPRLRASASDHQHDEMLSERGGSEWSGDRRSAEWRRVGGSTSRARHRGRAQLRCEGEPTTGFRSGCGMSRVEGRRQKTYDIIEVSLIIDASKPGLIRGARMRERDGNDDQEDQQRDAQARETGDVLRRR